MPQDVSSGFLNLDRHGPVMSGDSPADVRRPDIGNLRSRQPEHGATHADEVHWDRLSPCGKIAGFGIGELSVLHCDAAGNQQFGAVSRAVDRADDVGRSDS
jgi:hypothetical protein